MEINGIFFSLKLFCFSIPFSTGVSVGFGVGEVGRGGVSLLDLGIFFEFFWGVWVWFFLGGGKGGGDATIGWEYRY